MFWKQTLLHVLVAGTVACSTKDHARPVNASSSSSSGLAKTSSAPAATTSTSSPSTSRSPSTSTSPTAAAASTAKSTSIRSPTASAAAAPTVTDTSRGVTYVGLRTANGTVDKFLNIPYGADTGGAHRFANPRPAAPPRRGSVVDASAAGAVCPQPAAPGPFPWNSVATSFSEDCLRLKVARPAGTRAGARLPVMVYISGGGLYYGNINEVTNEPDGLIAQSVANGLPVVYVAMNYRLNVFGFALNDALRSQNSLNVGLKDQRLALQWVQDNIEYFGGDPDQVTIFGQSSGGLSATLQILAYGGQQAAPFHQAILQSTVLEPNMTGSITSDTFAEVARLTGCAASNGSTQSGATIRCLRALSTEQLWRATEQADAALSATTNGDLWLPAVDGDFLPASPSRLVREGRFARVPVVAGWTRDDATGGTPFTIATDADTRAFVAGFYPYLRAPTLEALLALYPVADFTARATDPDGGFSAEFYRAAQVYRDIFFVCPTFYFGYAMAEKYSGKKGSSIPVYYYELSQTIYEPYFALAGVTGLGVIHESDFPYVFANFTPYQDVLGDSESASDYELQRRMSRSWSNFAARGAPSGGAGSETLQGWQGAYDAGGTGGGMMKAASVFAVGGSSPGMSSVADPGSEVGAEKLAARCGFLNSPDVIQQLKY